MTSIKLGGAECPRMVKAQYSKCINCGAQLLKLNGIPVNIGCTCGNTRLETGKYFEVPTADIVDAIGVKTDD